MANVLTPVDVYAVVNDMSTQMFGDKAITAIDSSTFATVGEAMLRTGYENTLNALSYTIAKTIFAVRPYSAKFGIVEANTVECGAFILVTEWRIVIMAKMTFEQYAKMYSSYMEYLNEPEPKPKEPESNAELIEAIMKLTEAMGKPRPMIPEGEKVTIEDVIKKII